MSKPFTDDNAGVRSVERVLKPQSIAIIGASADPRAFGNFVLQNLERFGYAGAIHLVSRSSSEINGRACVNNVEALPEGIDLAVLCIPEAGVLDTVRVLGAKRTGAAVIFASGYSEAGDEGRARQHALTEAAHASGMALIGPNCMGFTNFEAGVPVTFEALAPYPCAGRNGVGVVAQSGAMAANMRDAFMGRGQPITSVVSTGNEAVLGIEDYLAWFIDDAQTSAIAIYVEQIRRPQTFLHLARCARAAGKPIVMLMPGKSARAREAAQSHTGALAGDHATASVLLAREGVVMVNALDELFDVTTILAHFPVPPAAGTALMTASGAVKNITLDFADDIGLTLPPLSAPTLQKLTELLPDYAVPDNPLDYTTIGVRNPGLIGELIDTVLADPNVGSLVLSIMGGPPIAQHDKADHIVPAIARATKPAVLAVMGDGVKLEDFFVEAIAASGVPFFRSPDRALRACAHIAAYGESLARAQRARSGTPQAVALPGAVPPNGIFAEYQGKGWLAAAGLPVPRGGLARSLDEALRVANETGYPVVLKAQASALPHKSDVGGVVVGLADADALRAGWEKLHASVSSHRPDLTLDGVLVEAMGPRGLELVVGAKRDADWGPVVLVGLGGIFIEVLKDVRLIPADLAEEDIVVELGRLKAAAMLKGVRGAAGGDVRAVAKAVAMIGDQMRANPAITEIDVNPLVAYPDRVLALDALVVCGAGQNAHHH